MKGTGNEKERRRRGEMNFKVKKKILYRSLTNTPHM